jgi:hypothetical protein
MQKRMKNNFRLCYHSWQGSTSFGGIGSGLGSLLLERLSVDYEMKYKLGFIVYLHSLLDHTDVTALDNETRTMFADGPLISSAQCTPT